MRMRFGFECAYFRIFYVWLYACFSLHFFLVGVKMAELIVAFSFSYPALSNTCIDPNLCVHHVERLSFIRPVFLASLLKETWLSCLT